MKKEAVKILEIAKKLFIIYLIEVIFFIAIIYFSYHCANFQYSEKTLIRVEETDDWLSSGYYYFYRYNYISYFVGMVMFLGIFLFLYKILMEKNTKKISDRHIVFRVLYWLMAGFLAFIMCFCLCLRGLFDDVYYEPDCLNFITYVVWPAFTVLFIGIDVIRKSIKQKRADKDLSDDDSSNLQI